MGSELTKAPDWIRVPRVELEILARDYDISFFGEKRQTVVAKWAFEKLTDPAGRASLAKEGKSDD